jgi:hypothetical protein
MSAIQPSPAGTQHRLRVPWPIESGPLDVTGVHTANARMLRAGQQMRSPREDRREAV